MKLTGPQWKQLQNALLSAAPTPSDLAQLVQFGLSTSLNTISLGDNEAQIVFQLIRWADSRGKTPALIAAALDYNPGNEDLVAVAQQFTVTPSLPPTVAPEAIVRAANQFQDLEQWMARLGAILPKVCRVEIASNKGPIYGTGFLLGPDTVITNYHVMESVILGEKGQATAHGESASPGNVVLRFDYKRLADGTTLNPGTEFRLPSAGWLIDSSPFGELDYALLRVAGSPGNSRMGTQADNFDPAGAAKPRGFLTPLTTYQFPRDTTLSIVQHPEGEPLQLAIETDGIIGVNVGTARVTYRTNTKPGSSGSPCFNANWDLVALHHAGDPRYDAATYNEGILFAPIIERLTKNNLQGALGTPA